MRDHNNPIISILTRLPFILVALLIVDYLGFVFFVTQYDKVGLGNIAVKGFLLPQIILAYPWVSLLDRFGLTIEFLFRGMVFPSIMGVLLVNSVYCSCLLVIGKYIGKKLNNA